MRGTISRIGVTVVAVVAVVAGCSSGGGSGGAAGAASSVTVGVTQPPRDLDPYDNAVPLLNIMRSAYDNLLRQAPDGTFKPALAESWNYIDPTTFTMSLRPGVKFADGTPLNAQVVKANLERAAAKPTAVTAQFAGDKPQITADSDMSVRVKLGQPDPDLTSIFAGGTGMIVHPDLVANPKQMATTMNGTGPYTYNSAKSITNASYVFDQKPGYWGAAAFPFKTVTWKVVSDLNSALNALLSGQIDVAPGAPEGATQVAGAGMKSVNGLGAYFAVQGYSVDRTKMTAHERAAAPSRGALSAFSG